MTAARDPYANLARMYDSMTNTEEILHLYSKWRANLLDAIRQYQIPVRVLVDLACGTGNTAIPWAKQKNWIVIGIDCSPTMLREARKKSRRVRWIRQDIRRLSLSVRADEVTCH